MIQNKSLDSDTLHVIPMYDAGKVKDREIESFYR